MTGETQHVYTISNTEPDPKHKEKAFSLELFAGKDGRDTDDRLSDNPDLGSRGCNDSGSQFSVKGKEPQNQREAVIRPQQAGKIDFKSLYNRPKFSSDGIWNNGKSGPQSPNGKSRAKEKTKRSGKGDRTQHQLYRLSITNSRSNPTIGIAYPQQKVMPPKKLEVSHGPILGSYRFHVPSISEREAELQQEDLSFHRCFQEVSSSLTSTNYTSQTKAAPRQHHGLKLQQGAAIDHESSGTNGQHHYLEFQANGTDSWQSPEKNFTGATYVISVPKTCPFPEGSKSSPHCFGSVPYQYPFQPLHDATSDPFGSESINQDYLDVALATNQAAQGAFAFHSSSSDDLEKSVSGAYDNLLKDGRIYNLPSQQTPFLHVQQAPGVQQQSPVTCYKGRNDNSTDLNGATSSSGAMASSGAIDQTVSTFQDSQTVFSSSKFSLHSISTPANKRQSTSNDDSPSQRTPLRRNMAHNSLPQVHFHTEVYDDSSANNANAGLVPLDKSIHTTAQNHAHMLQTWEGANDTYLPVDLNTVVYPTPAGNHFTYQCQSSVEQRHILKNSRMPWQQVHHTSVMPSQNRIELSRQLSNTEPAFLHDNSEWQGSNHIQKNCALNKPSGYHNREHMAGEELSSQRNDALTQNCSSSNNTYFHDSVTDTNSQVCDTRNTNQFFGMNQPVPAGSSRNTPKQTIALSLAGLVAASPCESPLPSPVPNTVSSSTCSSLSPMSSSPINPSSEENQLSVALAPSPFFHQSCQPKDIKTFHSSDPLHSKSLHYHQPEAITTFSFPSEVTKDDHVPKYLQENPFHKQNMETGNGCVNNFETEPPPPPYSSHHLLANSLSSASLDQLDVLLTCKQCDQNYSNLSSFLEHRQYCGMHAIFQSEMKDSPSGAECRKLTVDPLKPSRPVQGLPLPKGSSDLHEHLLGSNKCVDFLLDGEGKGDTKDDPLKVSIFNGLTGSSSVNASDLEIDEAKLDSLITEALNGLGYQSDNPEIDSNFMDVFVDEELSTMKAHPYRIKDHLTSAKTVKPKELDEQQTNQTTNAPCLEKNNQRKHPTNNRTWGQRHGETEGGATTFAESGVRQIEPAKEELSKGPKMENVLHEKNESHGRTKQKTGGNDNIYLSVQAPKHHPELSNLAKKQPNKKTLGSAPRSKVRPSPVDLTIGEESYRSQKTSVREKKKRKPRSSTWSKELIQKIVQQKNKLHKLHVKSSKNMQFSLSTERQLVTRQSLSFGEYDYISDSEDDLEYQKRHTKNQRNGRLKYTFTSKHDGMVERTKEREPAWKYSKTKEIKEHARDSGSESVKKDSCPLRARRRSSRSSSSSISSEMGNSSNSTEITDSGIEKEVVVRRKYTHTSNHATSIEIDAPTPPAKEASKEMHIPQEIFSRCTKRFGSAKFLFGSSKTHQRKTNIPQANILNEEPFPQATENQCAIKRTAHNYPEALFCKEETASEHREATSCTDIDSEYQSDLLMSHQNVSDQFPSYSANNADDHKEELTNSSHVAHTVNSADHGHCTEADMEYLKEASLCNDPSEFGYYNKDSQSVEMVLTGKEHSSYGKRCDAYEQKDLSDHYDCAQLFSKPLVIETRQIDDMYFCHTDINPRSFEHKPSNMASYATESAHNKNAPALNFDSSSIFGGLPVSEFDSPLYADVSSTKEKYVSYPCEANQSSKTTLFDQQYTQFLPEKDWDLVEEMSPMLSEGIGHFHNLCIEKALDKKYDNIGDASSSQVPIERISGCNVPCMNNTSDDELEIKRLVTELENHLQTNKPNTHAPSQPSTQHPSKRFMEDSSQYSTLPLNCASENEKNVFLSGDRNNLGNTCHPEPRTFVGNNLEDGPTARATIEGDYETHRSSWTCSVPFGALETTIHPSASKDFDSVNTFSSKEEVSQFQETLKSFAASPNDISKVMSYESPSALSDAGSPSLSGEDTIQDNMDGSTKCSTTTANVPLCHTNTADRQSNKKEAMQPQCNQHAEKCLSEQHKQEETFSDPPKLEPFESQSSHFSSESEFVPLLSMTSPTSEQHVTDSDEELPRRRNSPDSLQVPPALNSDKSILANDDNKKNADSTFNSLPLLYAETDDRKPLLFDIPSLGKEESSSSDSSAIPQGSAANPLQQLQLFVARTVKSNEAEMMMPGFPGLLPTTQPGSSAGVHPDPEGSEEPGSPGREGPSENTIAQQSDNSHTFGTGVLEEADVTSLTSELAKELEVPGSLEDPSPINAELGPDNSFKPVNGEPQHCETQQHHLGDEYSELDDINISTDAISQNHDSLLSFSDATLNPLPGQVKEENQIVNLLEADENQAALTFQKHRQSTYSSHFSFDREPLDKPLKPALYTSDAEGSLPCDKLCHDRQLPCALHLNGGNKPTEQNNVQEGQWLQFQGQEATESNNSSNPPENQEHNHLLPETSIYSAQTDISEKDNMQLSEILSSSYCNNESSNSLPLLNNSTFSHYDHLLKRHPENSIISDFGVQLPENPIYNTHQKSISNSDLLFPLTQGNFKEGHRDEAEFFPLTPPEYSSTVEHIDTSNSVKDCLADNILNSVEQPEQHLLVRSHALLCLSDNGQLENRQAFHMNVTQSRTPPGDQSEMSETLLDCVDTELSFPLNKEHRACSSTDTVPNSQLLNVNNVHACHSPVENIVYSTLSADLFTEMNESDTESSIHFQSEMKPENCFSHNEEAQHSLQDTLNCVLSIEEKNTISRIDPPSTADVSSCGLNVPQILEAIDTSSREASKALETTDKHLKTNDSEKCLPDCLDPVMNGVLNILNCEKSKEIFKSLGLPRRSGEPKDKKTAGLQVTCDVCSASFRSKPGLTRHKAVKHQMKRDGATLLKDTVVGGLVIPKKASKISRANSYKTQLSLSKQTISPNTHQEDNTDKIQEDSKVFREKSSLGFKVNGELPLSNLLNEGTTKKCPVSEFGQLYDSIAEEPPTQQPPIKGETRCKKQPKVTELNDNCKKTGRGKVRKRKDKMCMGSSSDSQVPSDDILNILKTNILKAITCPGQSSSFISTQMKEGCSERQQSHKAKPVSGIYQKLEDIGDVFVTKTISEQQLLDSPGKSHGNTEKLVTRENNLSDQEWIGGYLRHVEENVSDESGKGQDDIADLEENERKSSGVTESRVRSHEESLNYGPSSPAETHRSLRLMEAEGTARDAPQARFDSTPHSADSTRGEMKLTEPCSKNASETELHSLFDDDITFSLLFPRDDHFIRRKCTRVYGKRNKNVTPVSNASIKEAPSAELFSSQLGPSYLGESSASGCRREDSSDYETISVDDTLMLDMCHRSKQKENDVDSNSCETAMPHPDHEMPSPGKDAIDMDSDTLLHFLCQHHQAENPAYVNKSSSISNKLEEEGDDVLTRELYCKSPRETEDGHLFQESNPEALDVDGPYDSKKCRSPSEFHTIDMELLSTKLDSKQMNFVRVCEDDPNDQGVSKLSTKHKASQYHKENVSKTEDGKTTKSRSDVHLKPKNKQYKCKACFQWFLTLGELNFHKLSHNPCPPPTCYMCVQRKFSSREQLKDHLKEKHAKNKAGFWICGMCLKEISDVWMYNEHLREHATQFARKGQTQSVLGLHGSFADEAAVHTFLTRFIYQKPRKSAKHGDSENRCSTNLKSSVQEEPSEQESKTNENTQACSIQYKSTSPSPLKDSGSPPPELMQKKDVVETNPPIPSNLNDSALPLPEIVQMNDAVQKNAPIHPHCKDPSRDCHHCGKQFPKPFKLQRHLVVHSLQKIFLCHRCPMFYQDMQELRIHLKQQHDVAEEAEIKHTTLYACEMCADVMHVIKKSFICSTCNYTFSKKEQFDRHMEKHLVGGSTTFKFRRVMRPDTSGKETSRKPKEVLSSECMPPSKKRKTIPFPSPVHDSVISGPAVSHVHVNQTSDYHSCSESSPAPRVLFPEEVSNLTVDISETSVKMEHETGDFGDCVPEIDVAHLHQSSPPPCLSPPMPRDLKRDPELDEIPTLSINEFSNHDFDMKPLVPFLDTLELRVDFADVPLVHDPKEMGLPRLCTEQVAHTDGADTLLINNHDEKYDVLGEKTSLQDQATEGSSQCSPKTSTALLDPSINSSEANKGQKASLKNMNVNATRSGESSLKSNAVEVPNFPVPFKKVVSPDSSTTSRDQLSLKKSSPDTHTSNRLSLKTVHSSSMGDPPKSCSSKERTTPENMFSAREGSTHNMKETGGSHHKTPNCQLKSQFASNTVKQSSQDLGKPLEKPSLNASLKVYPKKRKDHLTLGYKSSSNCRENIEGEGKKKKNRVVGPDRNESPGSLKKYERTNTQSVQSSGREGALAKSFHCPKPKIGAIGSQIKKMVLDSYNQKKLDGRQHSNGECKRKKEILGKTFHQLMSKGTGSPLSGSLHKHRTVQGSIKPAECHNYRTAESQNNLLSKLFGQKLTSFKIPLRRDTAE